MFACCLRAFLLFTVAMACDMVETEILPQNVMITNVNTNIVVEIRGPRFVENNGIIVEHLSDKINGTYWAFPDFATRDEALLVQEVQQACGVQWSILGLWRKTANIMYYWETVYLFVFDSKTLPRSKPQRSVIATHFNQRSIGGMNLRILFDTESCSSLNSGVKISILNDAVQPKPIVSMTCDPTIQHSSGSGAVDLEAKLKQQSAKIASITEDRDLLQRRLVEMEKQIACEAFMRGDAEMNLGFALDAEQAQFQDSEAQIRVVIKSWEEEDRVELDKNILAQEMQPRDTVEVKKCTCAMM